MIVNNGETQDVLQKACEAEIEMALENFETATGKRTSVITIKRLKIDEASTGEKPGEWRAFEYVVELHDRNDWTEIPLFNKDGTDESR